MKLVPKKVATLFTGFQYQRELGYTPLSTELTHKDALEGLPFPGCR